MKRTVFAATASVLLASTFAIAQSQAPQPAQNPDGPRAPAAQQPAPSASQSQEKATEVRISGCLIQGSSPTVFIIDNARMATDPKTAEGKKYIVVMADAAGLRSQLNRQVTITGTTDGAVTVTTPPAGTPDAGQKPAVSVQVRESDLPKFSAKTIVRVADVCTTTE
jgi:hypothetical protein